MAVYNCQDFLKDAIDSILNQTFIDFEFIIIEDCSTDDSFSILNKIIDERVIIHRNLRNQGLTKSLNIGLTMSRGEYIARMDSDDISYSDRFAKQVKFLDNHKDVGVVGSWVKQIGASDSMIQYPQSSSEIFNSYLTGDRVVAHPTAMIRKCLLIDNNIKYDESFIVAQDLKLWNELKHYSNITNIQEPLLFYRIHNNSISKKNNLEQVKNRLRVIKDEYQRNYLRLPYSYELKMIMRIYHKVKFIDMIRFVLFLRTSTDLWYRFYVVLRWFFANVKALLGKRKHEEILEIIT